MDRVEANNIYNVDCLEGMKLIESGSIDMILCDLPYGVTDCQWDSVLPFDLLWQQYKRIIKPKGADTPIKWMASVSVASRQDYLTSR